MITVETDRLVEGYLRRLDAAASELPRERRAELVAEIREHLDEALREVDAADEVAVRNVLERLGPPEDIVHAAEPPAPVAPPDRSGRPGLLEIAALIALVIPFLGWLIGVVLVVASRAWSGRDKVVGVLLVLLAALLPAVGLVVAGAESGVDESVPVGDLRPVGEKQEDTGVGGAELLLFFVGLPSALFLGWRLRRTVS